jgi:predicted HTH domain antitoxin
MSLVISDEILKASEMSEKEFLLEIAIMLFQQEKISLAKASKIVGMNQIKFQTLLANRGIHYDVAEFKEDIKGLRERGWL